MKDFLRGLPLFKDIPEEQLVKLIAESREETFAPGEMIIEHGQPGRFLGVVLEGAAEAAVDDPDEGRVRLGEIAPGGLIGEMSLMTGEPTSAHVVAHEQCRVLLIPQQSFTMFMVSNPAVVKTIARTITERLRRREGDPKDKAQLKGAWKKHPDPYGLSLHTTKPMKLLVINCGSSSLKFNFFDTAKPERDARGLIERIGDEGTRLHYHANGSTVSQDLAAGDHAGAFEAMVEVLTDPDQGAVKDLSEIYAVGHRVVHGGEKYSQPVIVTAEVLAEIDKISHLAPLHNPVNVVGMREGLRLLPKAVQVAVFDTAFHHNMPIHAHLYGLPYDFYRFHGIRRYGFHGVSHNFVALKAAERMKKPFTDLKLITCHLGNGASMCAIDHGHSVDTSMGMTPAEGLIMGTRCGDLDPALVLYLQRELKMSVKEIDDTINRQSGLKGISGISNDLREIESAAGKGDRRALLAIQLFCYRIKKYIGAYAAAMGGLDALIFTGGIGENSTGVRARVCQGLGFLRIMIDDLKNQTAAPAAGAVAEIGAETSDVRVMVIPTDEERMIARETIRSLGFHQLAEEAFKHWEEQPIPIEVSAHHVHLSRTDCDLLFGDGYELTFKSPLSQPGQFACNEMVNLVGPKGRVDRVRILGPLRKQTQVEISVTEEFKLGIDAPIRPSGHLDGTPGITLEGAKGKAALDQGVICSLRHIHMTPEDALFYGLKDKDMVRVRVESERPLIFGEVLVRVDPNYKLNMHLDTDEANAAEIKTGMLGYLEAINDRK